MQNAPYQQLSILKIDLSFTIQVLYTKFKPHIKEIHMKEIVSQNFDQGFRLYVLTGNINLYYCILIEA